MAVETNPDSSGSDESTPSSGVTEKVISDRRLEIIRTSSLVVIAGLGTLAVLYVTRSVLFPVVLAILLNLLLSPLVNALWRIRIPPPVGAGVIVGLTLLIVVGGAALLVTPAAGWLDRAPESFREVEWKLRSIRESFKKFDEATKKVDTMTEMGGADEDAPIPVEVRQPRFANTLLNTSGNILAGAFLTTVLLYFLLASGDRFLTRLVEVMPTWREKRAMVELAHNIQHGMSVYLLTITGINVGLGLCIGIAMWLCEIPNPILWGTMAGLLNYIPFVGALVGACVVGLVGLLEYDTAFQALIPPALYIGINAIEANLITPTLLGRSVSLNPVMILLALAIWGWMWGVGGAIIAVPLLAVAKIFCDSFTSLQPLGKFLGD